MATPRDYDGRPERYRRGMRLAGPGLYEKVARMLSGRVLDLGCGEGALGRVAGPDVRLASVDASAVMLRAVPGDAVQADARALPFKGEVFDAVVAVNVLDHLEEPRDGLHEARRVLRPGGLFVAAAISREDAPELRHVWRPEPTPFDAEEAPEIVASVFGDAQVDAWDAPLVVLNDEQDVRDFLAARFVAEEEARKVRAPLAVTKRGALIFARRVLR